MSRTKAISFLVGVAALVVGVWIVRQVEWVDTNVPRPLTGEAATNPFYAAQRFAEALGARTTWNRYFDVPPADSVIVLNAWQWSLAASRRAALERWVEAGGRLVVDRTAIGDDAFEQWSGIGRSARGGPPARRRPPVVAGACPVFQLDAGAADAASSKTQFRVCDLQAGFALVATKPASWTLRGPSGVLAVRVGVGLGTVTAINARPFLDRSLFDGDHAALFVAATQLRRGDEVHFLSDGDHPSLVALTWQRGRPVVILMLALIALAVWRGMVRFGPLAAPEPVARRSLAEQILGTGRFAVRHGGGEVLLTGTLRALDEAARRRVSGFTRLSADQQTAALARLTGVDRAALAQARHETDFQPQRLRGAIALLEATRRLLTAQKRPRHGTD